MIPPSPFTGQSPTFFLSFFMAPLCLLVFKTGLLVFNTSLENDMSSWKPKTFFPLHLTLQVFWFSRLVLITKCLDKLITLLSDYYLEEESFTEASWGADGSPNVSIQPQAEEGSNTWGRRKSLSEAGALTSTGCSLPSNSPSVAPDRSSGPRLGGWNSRGYILVQQQ